eukprot:6201704-Pleurochrysis_carterae.AAC.5
MAKSGGQKGSSRAKVSINRKRKFEGKRSKSTALAGQSRAPLASSPHLLRLMSVSVACRWASRA